MRGTGNLDDIIADVLRETKTGSVREAPAPVGERGEAMRKLAYVLRQVPASVEIEAPSYADLYTVKEALYGR